MSAWYYSKDDQQSGPVSLQSLREFAASGSLHPSDLVWTTGMTDWARADAIAEIFPDHFEPSDASSPTHWFYARGGQRFGPVSFQNLKELAASGGIQRGDLTWTEGMTEWARADKIVGMFQGEGGEKSSTPTKARVRSGIKCPNCQAHLRVGLEQMLGEKRRCKACGNVFMIGLPDEVRRSNRANINRKPMQEAVESLSKTTVNSDHELSTPIPPMCGINALWVGLAILFCWPLGLFLLWRHPRLSQSKAWWGIGGIWSFIILVGLLSDKDKKMPTVQRKVAERKTSQVPEKVVEVKTRQAPEEAAKPVEANEASKSTARHNGGFYTSSWDYKNGCQVIYDSSVTKEETRRLGDYLEDQGFFNGDAKTFKLGKSGRTYEFRVIIKKGLEQDPEAIEQMKQLAFLLSQAVFNGAEVDIHLCDEKFSTIREFGSCPQSVAWSIPSA